MSTAAAPAPLRIALVVKKWQGFGGVQSFCIHLLAAARAHSRHRYALLVFGEIDDAGRAIAPANTRSAIGPPRRVPLQGRARGFRNRARGDRARATGRAGMTTSSDQPDAVTISTVIPSFRDPRILETIASVRAQDYPAGQVEIIVQDAGSDEALTGAIAAALGPRDRLVHEPDAGIFDGINRGLKKATGDLILTLGSDDRIRDPGLFARVAAERAGGANFIFCSLSYTDADWRDVRRWPAYRFTYFNYLIGRQFAHFALFCAPEVYERLGYFNTANRVNADYEFFHKALRGARAAGIRPGYVDAYAIQMKMGGNSSQSVRKMLAHQRLILGYALKNDPWLIPGLALKPVHKALEYMRAYAANA